MGEDARALAEKKGWKTVKTKWIDINKVDDDSPVYRSRLVGEEFNDGYEEGFFAGTPPVEALRNLGHEAATKDTEVEKVIMINDAARAFFEAQANRKVCIELPDKDLTEEEREKGIVG